MELTDGLLQRMVIDQKGFVGIGTTAPLDKLHIQGPNFSNSSLRFLNEAGSNPDFWNIGVRDFGGTREYFSFERNGTKTHVLNEGEGDVGIKKNFRMFDLTCDRNVDGDARIMLDN